MLHILRELQTYEKVVKVKVQRLWSLHNDLL